MESGGRSRFKLDEVGRVVTTRYNPSLLFATAAAAGGVAIDAAENDKAARIRRALAALNAQSRTLAAGSDLIPRFQIFLFPAILLVMLETLASDPRMRSRLAGMRQLMRGRRRVATALTAVLLVPQQGVPPAPDRATRLMREKNYAEAAREYRRLVRAGKASDRNVYNLGTSLLLADSLAAAISTLDGAARSSQAEVRYRALFNAGLAHLNTGMRSSGSRRESSLDAALDSYREALLLRPGDMDAKWNYELALRERERGGGGGGSPQQQEQNQQESRGDESEQRDSPSGLGREQAEQILDNAARDERDVRSRSQDRGRPSRPPGGKDW
jgi:Ca-activated chloride channel family protein